ncbi:MAG: cupin domain-containing protein [Pseudomonadota bacterium]
MSNANDDPLPPNLTDALLDAVAPVEPGAERRQRMQAGLTERIRAPRYAELLTVAGAGGDWQETGPGNRVKILRSDDETLSMLVQLDPGTTFPAHSHPADEETLVLQGETWFGDIHLKAGDYHLAPKGTEHGEVTTETGCTLFIRKAAE